MEITNNYSDYGKGYTNTAKEGNVITSTVELKTSKPGVTKTEQIKTGYSNVNDYSKYLQGKYSYMNTGTTSMQGVPTTVSVSGAFLKKCMDDPEKAKYLEENLAAMNLIGEVLKSQEDKVSRTKDIFGELDRSINMVTDKESNMQQNI